MGRSRYKFIVEDGTYFVTLTVLDWMPVFAHKSIVQILLDSLLFLQNEGLKIFAYVILENHLHLVVQSEQVGTDIARFKSFTARMIIEYLKKNNGEGILRKMKLQKLKHRTDCFFQFWQEGVHPELIHSDRMMRQKINYIHNNPIRRGYVDDAADWRYSSASNYLGEPGLLEVVKFRMKN